MLKKKIGQRFDSANKNPSRPLILIIVLAVLASGFLIGCETKEEDLTDKLYKNKTEFIGDNSKVSAIAGNLEYPETYDYDYIEIHSKDNDDQNQDALNQLNIIFKEDNNRGERADKAEFMSQSAILFSLIDNLDIVVYTTQEKDGMNAFAALKREDIESFTTSVLGMKTKEIGSSKTKFKKLVEFYQESLGEQTDLVPSKPIEAEKPSGELELDETINSLSGVKILAKTETISEEGLTLILQNKSDLEYIFSEDFFIQKKTGSSWEDVKPILKEGQYGFQDIALMLPAHDSANWAVDWNWLYGSLEKGKYRIVKQVIGDAAPGDTQAHYMGAEFEIK